jgi:hypothetical protein
MKTTKSSFKPSFSTITATAFFVLYLAAAALIWIDWSTLGFVSAGVGTLCGFAWVWKRALVDQVPAKPLTAAGA